MAANGVPPDYRDHRQWYLRKSLTRGPVRLNLSKSGVGASFDVKGAALSMTRGYVLSTFTEAAVHKVPAYLSSVTTKGALLGFCGENGGV